MKAITEENTIVHATFAIERNYDVAPERVFAAFEDPKRKRRWFVEGEGWIVDEFTLDFRVGGRETSRFRMKDSPPMGNDTVFMDIVPGRRIVVAYTMTIGDKRISASLATFDFEPNGKGTKATFTEQSAFFQGGDGAERRKAGWTELLGKLGEELTKNI